jgi:hypothetical protein
MSKRLSLVVSLGLLAAFAVTALAVGRPALPLFDELPSDTAAGLIAYQDNDCVFVADLDRATITEAHCPSLDDEEGIRRAGVRFAFTEDGKLQVGTWESSTAVVIDPTSGATEGESVWDKSAEGGELAEMRFADWQQKAQSDGLLITIEGQEHLLSDMPKAYRLHTVISSPDGVWAAAQDNVEQLVLLGPSGPWVVTTGLDDYTPMAWGPKP